MRTLDEILGCPSHMTATSVSMRYVDRNTIWQINYKEERGILAILVLKATGSVRAARNTRAYEDVKVEVQA
jgi:hypothetical protein